MCIATYTINVINLNKIKGCNKKIFDTNFFFTKNKVFLNYNIVLQQFAQFSNEYGIFQKWLVEIFFRSFLLYCHCVIIPFLEISKHIPKIYKVTKSLCSYLGPIVRSMQSKFVFFSFIHSAPFMRIFVHV